MAQYDKNGQPGRVIVKPSKDMSAPSAVRAVRIGQRDGKPVVPRQMRRLDMSDPKTGGRAGRIGPTKVIRTLINPALGSPGFI
ncbi:MAG: hypothetical protein HY985_01580 [Magnetospirillum sp.]|nr:hypothetical protein [Magnetospirillum sp.]